MTKPILPRIARHAPASHQDTLASRYPGWVRVLAMAAFSLAFAGWLNETWLFFWESPIWLNRYTEYAIILGFGLWRIRAEKNPYTRRRLIILVTVVTVFWWLIPWLIPFFEFYVGYLWTQPVFPALHSPGTLSFMLVLVLVLLFGRRVICAFGCPCVAIRETVGFPYRFKTLRGPWGARLRHVKWFFFVWYVGVMVATQFPPTAWTVTLTGLFGLAVGLTYFGSFFLVPITGNRFYCRSLCPFGATFGLLNSAGLYDVRMDADRCIDCARCDQACDMGIPIMRQGKETGHVTRIEDCMGCARCVISCPTDALEIRDVRNLMRSGLRQDATHLLKGEAEANPVARIEPRTSILSPDEIIAQAARCLDCGEPACRSACPLQNRIPDWLAHAARGEFEVAAELTHLTSPLPEFCGMLCPHERLCEGACVRHTQGVGAVAIGAVEHSVVETALAGGWKPNLVPSQRLNRTAVAIGAGPAGLGFAQELNRAGWKVTVIDRDTRIGGMLSSGLPPFRFDKNALARRQALLEAAGIDFRLGVEVDEDLFADLASNYDAVFLGVGARRSRTLEIPGYQLSGTADALGFLADVNRDLIRESLVGQRVVVLGGGETAMDCARVAVRGGAATVTVAYRGPGERMRASTHERELAAKDGVNFLFEHSPVAFEGEQAISSIRFGINESDEIRIYCDRVILALGQEGSAPEWLGRHDVVLDAGIVNADPLGRTDNPKIYTGGDCAHGPDLISTAAAAGRRAANAVLENQRLFKKLRRSAVPQSPQQRLAREVSV